MKADHTQVTRLLKTARGQIDGILKMVEEDRYCLEVSSQIMAAQSILKKANRMVLKAHMDCCVREAVASGAPDEKLEELAALLEEEAARKGRHAAIRLNRPQAVLEVRFQEVPPAEACTAQEANEGEEEG